MNLKIPFASLSAANSFINTRVSYWPEMFKTHTCNSFLNIIYPTFHLISIRVHTYMCLRVFVTGIFKRIHARYAGWPVTDQ